MATRSEASLTDRNGKAVHAFTIEMANLGFERMTEHIKAMLEAGAWMDWRDGIGHVELLPGEFDYFLSMCGVTRDMVMTGVRDIAAKARMAEAMDERRAGEDGYRRDFEEVKAALGRRKAEPYGYTQAEARALHESGFVKAGSTHRHRAALGEGVRRFAKTGETRAPSLKRSKLERLEATIRNLDDDDFDMLSKWLDEHRSTRTGGDHR